IGFAERHRHSENLFGQLLNLCDARAAAAQKNSGTQVIEQAGRADFLDDEPKNLLDAQGHDAAQMFEVDGTLRQTMLVREGNGLALHALVHQRGAVFDLELFGETQGNFQSVSQIVRDVVAADRQQSGVLDDAIRANDVFGRAASDVNDQSAQFLLLAAQQGQRRGQSVENDVFDLQLQTFHRPNRVLQPVEIAVDHMHVHIHFRAEHADRILNAVLAIHAEVLANDVDHVILGRQVDGLGVFDRVLHVFVGDLAVGGNDRMHAAIVKAAQMPATDAKI